jgi:hypothetical protein
MEAGFSVNTMPFVAGKQYLLDMWLLGQRTQQPFLLLSPALANALRFSYFILSSSDRKGNDVSTASSVGSKTAV